jgi:hypothetical protein
MSDIPEKVTRIRIVIDYDLTIPNRVTVTGPMAAKSLMYAALELAKDEVRMFGAEPAVVLPDEGDRILFGRNG